MTKARYFIIVIVCNHLVMYNITKWAQTTQVNQEITLLGL